MFIVQAPELEKIYPSFINYFEKTKETISSCDRSKPRFHAFLRVSYLVCVLLFIACAICICYF